MSKKKNRAAFSCAPSNPLFHKEKTDLHSQVGFMELMTGFEPVTSSLPKILIWRVGAFFFTVPESVSPT